MKKLMCLIFILFMFSAVEASDISKAQLIQLQKYYKQFEKNKSKIAIKVRTEFCEVDEYSVKDKNLFNFLRICRYCY